MFTVSFFFSLSIYLFWNQDILRKLKYFTPHISVGDHQFSDLKDLQYVTSMVYDEKIFKENKNNLADIAKRIGIPKVELSNLINTEFSSFNTWINDIKIRYSIELIQDSYLKNYSVEALTKECGFNSPNTFYRAFKIKTGKTPSNYLDSYQKNKE